MNFLFPFVKYVFELWEWGLVTVILFNSHHRASDLIRFRPKYLVFEKWTCSLYWRRHLDPEQKCFQLPGTEIILLLSMKCNKYFVFFNVYISAISVHLKVHKHEIILIFFWPKSNPYMPFVNFQKKFRFFSFDFRQHFDVRIFPRWLSIRGTNFFYRDIQTMFFFNIFTLFLLYRFLDGFSVSWFFIGKICILIRDFWVIFKNYSMRMLSIPGNDFIACWAYAEPISSHAEHTMIEFPHMLSQR